jgi:hypothetical protein
MNFRASSKFVPVDIARVQAAIVPRIVAAVTAGCAAIVGEAQIIAPVETGEYRASIHTGSVELVGNLVTGTVVADSDHAAFVEYGTGQRGAASGEPGGGPFSPTWPGMSAQAPMRRGTDLARPAIVEAFAAQGFKV